ncbi:hypothetical protein CLF_112799, partial [Clonorchis sinensis]
MTHTVVENTLRFLGLISSGYLLDACDTSVVNVRELFWKSYIREAKHVPNGDLTNAAKIIQLNSIAWFDDFRIFVKIYEYSNVIVSHATPKVEIPCLFFRCNLCSVPQAPEIRISHRLLVIHTCIEELYCVERWTSSQLRDRSVPFDDWNGDPVTVPVVSVIGPPFGTSQSSGVTGGRKTAFARITFSVAKSFLKQRIYLTIRRSCDIRHQACQHNQDLQTIFSPADFQLLKTKATEVKAIQGQYFKEKQISKSERLFRKTQLSRQGIWCRLYSRIAIQTQLYGLQKLHTPNVPVTVIPVGPEHNLMQRILRRQVKRFGVAELSSLRLVQRPIFERVPGHNPALQ